MESLPRKKFNIAFFGTPEIATSLLLKLEKFSGFHIAFVITQQDKKGNNGQITKSAVKKEAEILGIPVYQPSSDLEPLCKQLFQEHSIDMCLLFAYGSIIPASLLYIPRLGWLNVHPSLLPRFRGASPIQEALLEGDTTTGISLIVMDEGIDTGPILEQRLIPISNNETTLSLSKKVTELVGQFIPEVAFHYACGKRNPKAQPEKGQTMTRRLSKNDGKIDWQLPSVNIERMIRAYTPWPGTFAFLENKRIKILEASLLDLKINKQPGSIVFEKDSCAIVCGKHTALRLHTLQRAGKNMQSAEEFFRGFQQKSNLRFV